MGPLGVSWGALLATQAHLLTVCIILKLCLGINVMHLVQSSCTTCGVSFNANKAVDSAIGLVVGIAVGCIVVSTVSFVVGAATLALQPFPPLGQPSARNAMRA